MKLRHINIIYVTLSEKRGLKTCFLLKKAINIIIKKRKIKRYLYEKNNKNYFYNNNFNFFYNYKWFYYIKL